MMQGRHVTLSRSNMPTAKRSYRAVMAPAVLTGIKARDITQSCCRLGVRRRDSCAPRWRVTTNVHTTVGQRTVRRSTMSADRSTETVPAF